MKLSLYSIFLAISLFAIAPAAPISTQLIIEGGALAILGWTVYYLLSRALPEERKSFLRALQEERKDFLQSLDKLTETLKRG